MKSVAKTSGSLEKLIQLGVVAFWSGSVPYAERETLREKFEG